MRVDGIIVPGGFGDRGINGKIAAIRYARENKIPFWESAWGCTVQPLNSPAMSAAGKMPIQRNSIRRLNIRY